MQSPYVPGPYMGSSRWPKTVKSGILSAPVISSLMSFVGSYVTATSADFKALTIILLIELWVEILKSLEPLQLYWWLQKLSRCDLPHMQLTSLMESVLSAAICNTLHRERLYDSGDSSEGSVERKNRVDSGCKVLIMCDIRCASWVSATWALKVASAFALMGAVSLLCNFLQPSVVRDNKPISDIFGSISCKTLRWWKKGARVVQTDSEYGSVGDVKISVKNFEWCLFCGLSMSLSYEAIMSLKNIFGF